MSLAQFADASFAYPGNEILDGASLLIRPGDRLALVGPNGTGKSTALRLLSGDFSPTAATCACWAQATMAYLRQSQELSGAGTVLEALLEPFADLQKIHDRLVALEARLADGDAGDLASYGELQERYQRGGGYELEARVKRLTADVGFSEADLGRSIDTRRAASAGGSSLRRTGAAAGPPADGRADQPPGPGGDERLEAFLPNTKGRSCWSRTIARSSAPSATRSSSWRTASSMRYPYRYDKYVVERAARLERAAGRVRAAKGARRQDRGLHPPQPGRAEDQAGPEPPQDAGEAGAARSSRRQWEHAGKIGLSFQTGGELGSKETIRAPKLTVGYAGADARYCAT